MDESQHACLNFTTNPGLEDIAITECRTRLHRAGIDEIAFERKPHGLGGYLGVQCETSPAQLWDVARQMRSIHHVHRPIASFTVPEADGLTFIQHQVRALDIPEMDTAGSFRVTSKRSGRHDFTSMDVQKVAGAALVDRYQCQVNLTEYDVNIRVDIFDRLCYVAVQMTRRPLDFRFDYAYRPRIALKTNVAFALLCLAHLQPDGIPAPDAPPAGYEPPQAPLILDPFCGSGTIVMEAARCLPQAQLFANDAFERPVVWTQDNIAANGLCERIHVQQMDARHIHTHFAADSLDAIVTNPPFGAFLGANTNFHTLYQHFLNAAWHVLRPGGYLALMVWKRGVFNRVADKMDFQIRHVRIVDVGGIFPGMFMLRKPT